MHSLHPGSARQAAADVGDPAQVDAARGRALQAGRRYPNLVDNMWAARHVPRGDEAATRDAAG